MLLFAFIAFTVLPALVAAHEFVRNVPDSRCKARGDFIIHPTDRCKYMVCEYDSGSKGYLHQKMYARVMQCAPGTLVPLKQYHNTRAAILRTPCTEFYKGTCPAGGSRGSYGSPKSPSPFYHQQYAGKTFHNGHGHSNNGPKHEAAGHGYSKKTLSITDYGYSKLRRRHVSKHPAYSILLRPRYEVHHRAFGKSASSYALPVRKPVKTKPDPRCKMMGQFLTHPYDHCKYMVCEFGRNLLAKGRVYDLTKLYAREMPCAPGTAVRSSKYLPSYTNSSPCTEFYSGHCPVLPKGSPYSKRPSYYRYF